MRPWPPRPLRVFNTLTQGVGPNIDKGKPNKGPGWWPREAAVVDDEVNQVMRVEEVEADESGVGTEIDCYKKAGGF